MSVDRGSLDARPAGSLDARPAGPASVDRGCLDARGPGAATAQRVVRGLTRTRLHPAVLWAFIGSRILTAIAGAVGVRALPAHAPAATVSATARALGPLGNVLAGSADRFDSAHYLAIAAHGYGSGANVRVAFFPLYPLLIRALTPVFGNAVLAGMALSAAAFLGSLEILHRLTELGLGRRAANLTVVLLACSPLAFFFTAVYSESLFLLLTVGAALAVRRNRWGMACALGALAALTRPTGVVVVVLLAVARIRRSRGLDRGLVCALAPLAALIAYLVALRVAGFPWLAPFRVQALWHRETVGPVLGLLSATWRGVEGALSLMRGGALYAPHSDGPFPLPVENLILLLDTVAAGIALVWCRRTLSWELTLYAAAVLVVCVSSPIGGEPLGSVDRFILTAFPLWMAAGGWLARRSRLQWPVIGASCALLVFYTLQFASWSFVA